MENPPSPSRVRCPSSGRENTKKACSSSRGAGPPPHTDHTGTAVHPIPPLAQPDPHCGLCPSALEPAEPRPGLGLPPDHSLGTSPARCPPDSPSGEGAGAHHITQVSGRCPAEQAPQTQAPGPEATRGRGRIQATLIRADKGGRLACRAWDPEGQAGPREDSLPPKSMFL